MSGYTSSASPGLDVAWFFTGHYGSGYLFITHFSLKSKGKLGFEPKVILPQANIYMAVFA